MSRKRYAPEQIIGKLREAEVLLSKGQTVGQACRKLGVTKHRHERRHQRQNPHVLTLGPRCSTWLARGVRHPTSSGPSSGTLPGSSRTPVHS